MGSGTHLSYDYPDFLSNSHGKVDEKDLGRVSGGCSVTASAPLQGREAQSQLPKENNRIKRKEEFSGTLFFG